jgi:hypothetical protein
MHRQVLLSTIPSHHSGRKHGSTFLPWPRRVDDLLRLYDKGFVIGRCLS